MEKSTLNLSSLAQTEEELKIKAKSFNKRVTKLIVKIISGEGSLDRLTYADGFYLLSDLASDIPCFYSNFDTDTYQKALGLALFFWLHERQDNTQNKRLQAKVLQELKRRQNQDKKRTDNRSDRVDKLAFQKAVKENLERYATVADAVSDLKEEPQFEKYITRTLWDWAREVWTKPITVGRPRKSKGNNMRSFK